MGDDSRERVSVVVVGAGLATSHHLTQAGIDHLVLEAADRVGESWRSRWDSLRLFTPGRYDGLPGRPFPAPLGYFPTKDEMAEYLEAYVDRFQLPIRLGVRIDGLSTQGDRYVLTAGGRTIEAGQVVVATGAHQTPRIPAWAGSLDPSIMQIHAAHYRNPTQLPAGAVLVVGAGNSGVEMAIEVAEVGHPTRLAGKSTGRIPAAAYVFNGAIFWFLANRVLSIDTPIGRRVKPNAVAHGGPLIRRTLRDAVAAGVEMVPRAAMALEGRPRLEDGRCLDVASVIWCTGFGHDFGWTDLAGFSPSGLPVHERGAVPSQPGLYFIGLPFQTRLASAFVGGVAGDARPLVRMIAARLEGEAAPGRSGVLRRPTGAASRQATRP